jgi:hypothetical protein
VSEIKLSNVGEILFIGYLAGEDGIGNGFLQPNCCYLGRKIWKKLGF